MHSSIFPDKFDDLKKQIEKAFAQLRQQPGRDFSELIHDNLNQADTLLVQARNHLSDAKTRDKANVLFERARLRFNLALAHSSSRQKVVGWKLNGKAQLAISELSERINAFKAHIEWKNIDLLPEQRRKFVECAELFEDSINQLRTGKRSDAERTACGAIVLLMHLCAVVDDQHDDKFANESTFSIKLPPEVSSIKSLVETLSLMRQTVSNNRFPDAAAARHWNFMHEKADEDLLAAIDAFINYDSKLLTQKNLSTQDQIKAMRAFTSELASQALVSKSDGEMPSVALPMAGADFEKHIDSLGQAINGKIHNPDLLNFELFTLRKIYKKMIMSVVGTDNTVDEVLISKARNQIQRVSLLVSQAKLFYQEQS